MIEPTRVRLLSWYRNPPHRANGLINQLRTAAEAAKLEETGQWTRYMISLGTYPGTGVTFPTVVNDALVQLLVEL